MPRKLISLSAAAASLAAVFAAAPAQALTVTSDAGGLKLVEPGFNRADVKLALVNAGGVKYRVETPNFGGSAITTGAGCVNQSSVGTAVALCQRINPKVSEVKFGTGRGDRFEVAPNFPDPITVNDQDSGADFYFLGAGNDFGRGSGGDSFSGRGGNDDFAGTRGTLDGGEGNDRLHSQRVSFTPLLHVLRGGPGDDVLTADSGARVRMTGDEGKDSFDAGGSRSVIESRDGVKEKIVCGKPKFRQRGRVFRVARIDLADTPNDADLAKGGCLEVERAPQGEKNAARLVSTSLKLRRGVAGVKVKCATRARCRGRVSLTVKGRSRSARFSIRGRRTATIRLGARRGSGTVKIRENGKAGARTTRAALAVKR